MPGGCGMLTMVVRFSFTDLGGITTLSIGPSPTGSAWITWAFMDLASSLVLSGIAGSASGARLSGATLLSSGVGLLAGLAGDTGGDRLAAGTLSLPNLCRITADRRGCPSRHPSHRHRFFTLTLILLLELLRLFHPCHHRLRHARSGELDLLRFSRGISAPSARIYDRLWLSLRFLLPLDLLHQSGTPRLS